ncbi:GrpB family protein [Rubripirellula reticaptiva]|uniref:Dephospho-CoA kinase/protein folding accessory domain-containing protein n=1 Tax=Rubripirellula reticaptiva TaxID=2528013 RepID=A0A5C6FEM9_9BACT|nr:GrpB family protein [Rubripirellula reticaptiva]TWU58041.1 dephospho-CoA kinase/protein folding accessory domain-containing protein [Rubripirellula reticaptiva]
MLDEPVRLMHYDPRWRQEFQQTRSSILASCEGWVNSVEHIGSTAISGLIARPTIDVIALVPNDEAIQPARQLIEGLNFRIEPTASWATDVMTLEKPRAASPGMDPTHRVMLVVQGAPVAIRTVRFRDYLRSRPEVAIRWEEFKVAAWRDSDGDFLRYESEKSVFIAHLEDQMDAASDCK